MILLGIRSVAALVGRSRQWLVLIAVVMVAACFYVKFELVRVDRDRLLGWATAACATTGEGFMPSIRKATSTGGRSVTVIVRRGARCEARIISLAAFERATAVESARIMADAVTDAEARTASDEALARIAAEAAREANERMEKANAKVEDDRTGSVWFDALNDLAGLRAPRP